MTPFKIYRLTQKAAAIFLSLSLVWTSGNLAEATLAAPQVFANPVLPPQFALVPPPQLGRVTDYYNAPSKDHKLVILIQDLHAHYRVQKNIAGILEFLTAHLSSSSGKSSSPAVVSGGPVPFALAVEGAQGPVDSSVLALFPDQAIKGQAADYLMRQGELTGVEYFGVMRGIPSLPVGVEDAQYYNLHRELFRKTLAGRQHLVGILKGIEADLRPLQVRLYGPKLRAVQDDLKAFEDGRLSTDELVGRLIRASQAAGVEWKGDFPDLAQFAVAVGQSDAHAVGLPSPEQLSDYMKEFLTGAQPYFTSMERQTLTALAKGKDTTRYFLYLRDLIQTHQLFLAAPVELLRYLEYVHTSQTAGMDHIVHDASQLAFRLKLASAAPGAEKDLVQVEHDLSLLVRMANVQTTEAEVKTFGPRLNQFVALCQSLLVSNGIHSFDEIRIRELISSSIDYYALALMRNKPMVDNTLALMKGAGRAASHSTAVLVTGGFHTEAMAQLLREHHTSYVVITPTVDSLTDADQALYIKRLSGDLLTVQDILSDAKSWPVANVAQRSLERTPSGLSVGFVAGSTILLAALVSAVAFGAGHTPSLDTLTQLATQNPLWAHTQAISNAIAEVSKHLPAHSEKIAAGTTAAMGWFTGKVKSEKNEPILLIPQTHLSLEEVKELSDTIGNKDQPGYAARINSLLKKYIFQIETYHAYLETIQQRYRASGGRLAIAPEFSPEEADNMLRQAQNALKQWPDFFREKGIANPEDVAEKLILLYYGPVIYAKAKVLPRIEVVALEDSTAKKMAALAGMKFEKTAQELFVLASRQGMGAYTQLGHILHNAVVENKMPSNELLAPYLAMFDPAGRMLAREAMEYLRLFIEANHLRNKSMADTLRNRRTPVMAVIGAAHTEELKTTLSGRLDVLAEGTSLDAEPKSASALAQRGLRLLDEGKQREAIKDLEEAIRQRRDFLGLYMSLGAAHFELGEYPQAVQVYRDLVRALPEFAEAQFHLAWNLHLAGEPAEANAVRAIAIRLKPDLKAMQWPPHPSGPATPSGTAKGPGSDLNIADTGLEAGPHEEVNAVLDQAFLEGRVEYVGDMRGVRVYKVKGVGAYLTGTQRGHAGLARNQIYIAEDSFADPFLKDHEIEELKLWQRMAMNRLGISPDVEWALLEDGKKKEAVEDLRIYLATLSDRDRKSLIKSIDGRANLLAMLPLSQHLTKISPFHLQNLLNPHQFSSLLKLTYGTQGTSQSNRRYPSRLPRNGMDVTEAYADQLNIPDRPLTDDEILLLTKLKMERLALQSPGSRMALRAALKEIRTFVENGQHDKLLIVARILAAVIGKIQREEPDRFILHFARDMGFTLVIQRVLAALAGRKDDRSGALFLNRDMMGSHYGDLHHVLDDAQDKRKNLADTAESWFKQKMEEKDPDFLGLAKATEESLARMGFFEQEKILLLDTGYLGTMPWFVYGLLRYRDAEAGRPPRNVQILLIKSSNSSPQLSGHQLTASDKAFFAKKPKALDMVNQNSLMASILEEQGDQFRQPVQFNEEDSIISPESPDHQLWFYFVRLLFINMALAQHQDKVERDMGHLLAEFPSILKGSPWVNSGQIAAFKFDNSDWHQYFDQVKKVDETLFESGALNPNVFKLYLAAVQKPFEFSFPELEPAPKLNFDYKVEIEKLLAERSKVNYDVGQLSLVVRAHFWYLPWFGKWVTKIVLWYLKVTSPFRSVDGSGRAKTIYRDTQAYLVRRQGTQVLHWNSRGQPDVWLVPGHGVIYLRKARKHIPLSYLRRQRVVSHRYVNAYIAKHLPDDLSVTSAPDPEALNRYRDTTSGILVIPIKGLYQSTGQFAHAGLGRVYGEPVVYIHAGLTTEDRGIVLEHELFEIGKWEEKRAELGLAPDQMRDWIKAHYNEAFALGEKWHFEAPPVHHLFQGQYGQAELEDPLAYFDVVNDINIAAGSGSSEPGANTAALPPHSSFWQIHIHPRGGDSALPSETEAALLASAQALMSQVPARKIVNVMRKMAGDEHINEHDLTGQMDIEYYDKGSHKYVFKVTIHQRNGKSARFLLAYKTSRHSRNDISTQEIGDLQKLRGRGVPKFGLLIPTENGDPVFLEEFIEGPSATALAKTGGLTQEKRKSIVQTILVIGTLLGGNVPRDAHASNFIFRNGTNDAVMVDLGVRRLTIHGESAPSRSQVMFLSSLVANYGDLDTPGGSDFIFETVVEQFGAEAGRRLLERVYETAASMGPGGLRKYLYQKGESTFWVLDLGIGPQMSLDQFADLFMRELDHYLRGYASRPHESSILPGDPATRRVRKMIGIEMALAGIVTSLWYANRAHGGRQLRSAWKLFRTPTAEVAGPVDMEKVGLVERELSRAYQQIAPGKRLEFAPVETGGGTVAALADGTGHRIEINGHIQDADLLAEVMSHELAHVVREAETEGLHKLWEARLGRRLGGLVAMMIGEFLTISFVSQHGDGSGALIHDLAQGRTAIDAASGLALSNNDEPDPVARNLAIASQNDRILAQLRAQRRSILGSA